MSVLTRIVSVTRLNLSSIPERAGDSLVIVIGVAGVVAVLVSILAMSTGFQHTVSDMARPDRAIVLSAGSESEVASYLSRPDVVTVLSTPGVKRSASGELLASAEYIAVAPVKRRSDGSDAFITLRGIGPLGTDLRPEVRLVAGRMFQLGVREVIVGVSAQRQFERLELGDEVRLGDGTWKVVGTFISGSSHESGLLADSETVLSAYRANAFHSVSVQLETPEALRTFKDSLTSNPALDVHVIRETDYVAATYGPFTRILRFVAYVVGGIMGIGAVFAALNTMYSAVSARGTEIATLRAIGFGAGVVVLALFIEALVLAVVGAIIGVSVSFLTLNGDAISTVANTVGNNPQVVYSFAVTPSVVVIGIGLAAVIGLIGALLPAVRAARLPVASALRAL